MRWEHGQLGIALTHAPRLFARALELRSIQVAAFALDLCIPPLSLLSILVACVWLASLACFQLTGATLALGVATAPAALIVLSAILAWIRYGRPILSLGDLALGAVYALWKIPLYARFLVARQLDWVRSKRD